MCLEDCLSEAEAHSKLAGAHLRQAIAAIANGGRSIAFAGAPKTTTPQALAAYLEFLLPDLAGRSPRAAGSVRCAIQSLRDPLVDRPGALH